MKKMLSFFALTIFFTSCGAKYSHLKDGLYADIQTNKGNMVVQLFYKQTPITVANFVSLAEGNNPYVADSLKGKKFYNGLIFHRVIKDFMIQGGDPQGIGIGGPGYQFTDEFVDTLEFNKKGQLAMANAGPETNGSQFFITQGAQPHLTGRHTIFGQVVEGEQVIDDIANVETQNDKPKEDVIIQKVEIIRKGAEAKKFNAPKVFENYMKEQDEILRKRDEAKAAAIAKFKEEIQKQRTEAKKVKGVEIFTIKEGNTTPKKGQKVLVNYAGYLADGTLFDSNEKSVAETYNVYDRRRDQMGGYRSFPMVYSEEEQLIPGFKNALLSMKVGEKVRVFIPSDLAYGKQGAGNVIPPDADLIFDIEIVGVE